MKRLLIIIPLCIVTITASFFLFNKFVSAQNAGQGLEISPPTQEVSIDPGKTITVKAKIRNRGNATVPLRVRVQDFTARGEDGQIELTADSPYSITGWTRISPTSFTLNPGAEQEVIATITAPKDAAGGHFGSFIFQTTAEEQQGNAGVSQEIASLFLVKVSGPVNEKVTIKDFSTEKFAESAPVPLRITYANSGNVHVKTYGLINVTDMFGKKVADLVVPPTNIFPQADRIVTTDFSNTFLIGPYKATALIYYGSGQAQSLTATTSFFVFPVKIAAGIAVILFFLFLLRKRLKKSFGALFGK